MSGLGFYYEKGSDVWASKNLLEVTRQDILLSTITETPSKGETLPNKRSVLQPIKVNSCWTVNEVTPTGRQKDKERT